MFRGRNRISRGSEHGSTIILAEIDPLRSEGKMLAKRLEGEVYDGVTHEFFGMGLVVGEAADAEKFAARGLKKGFGTSTLFWSREPRVG